LVGVTAASHRDPFDESARLVTVLLGGRLQPFGACPEVGLRLEQQERRVRM
jgi:hypothetical protein